MPDNSFLTRNRLITEDVIMDMAECIASATLKTYSLLSDSRRLDKMYIGLNTDRVQKHNTDYIFSDGYDLVQEAVLYLWEHVGESLDDMTGTDVKSRTVSVIKGCFSRVNHLIFIERKISRASKPDNCPEAINLSVDFEDATEKKEEDYTAIDEMIRRMRLTPLQAQTLEYLINGMPLMHIAEMYHVKTSSIWLRRRLIQKKYHKYIEVAL